MKSLPFILQKPELLRRLASPFVAMWVQVDVIKRPNGVKFWYGPAEGIQIFCRMIDITPRFEMGVLEFVEIREPDVDDQDLNVPKAFGEALTIEKLTVADNEACADAGLALANRNRHEEILVLASVNPCGLAVRTPWGGAADFFSSPYFFSPASPRELSASAYYLMVGSGIELRRAGPADRQAVRRYDDRCLCLRDHDQPPQIDRRRLEPGEDLQLRQGQSPERHHLYRRGQPDAQRRLRLRCVFPHVPTALRSPAVSTESGSALDGHAYRCLRFKPPPCAPEMKPMA